MRKMRDRRQVSVDLDHMRRLHQESLEQLELMRTALDAYGHTSGAMRDILDDMAHDHWNSYQDVLHMIVLHDDQLAAVLSRHGMSIREEPAIETPVSASPVNRPLLSALLSALILRHRRFCSAYSLRVCPMSDYIRESMTTEREHIAELIAMLQTLL